MFNNGIKLYTTFAAVAVVVLAVSGCNSTVLPSDQSKSSSSSNGQQSSVNETSSASQDLSAPSSAASSYVEPPSVSEEMDIISSNSAKNINFTELDRDQLKEILQPILDEALRLCNYGYYENFTDFTQPSIMIDNKEYFPTTGIPYASVAELKLSMASIFTQDILDTQLAYLVNSTSYADYEGELYVIAAGGYSKGRMWDTRNIEILNSTPDTLIVSMEVQFMDNIFAAQITFKCVNGNIMLGEDYFAVTH